MDPAGFEPATPGSKRLQTHALERAVTMTVFMKTVRVQNINMEDGCARLILASQGQTW